MGFRAASISHDRMSAGLYSSTSSEMESTSCSWSYHSPSAGSW